MLTDCTPCRSFLALPDKSISQFDNLLELGQTAKILYEEEIKGHFLNKVDFHVAEKF